MTISGDALNEATETYTVGLSAPGNATLADDLGAGTITNDDPLPTLTIGDATVNTRATPAP